MKADFEKKSIDIPRDSITNCIPTITSSHVGVHNGEAYTATYSINALAAGASITFDISTAADMDVYIKDVLVWAQDGINLYELGGGHTIIGGTVVPAFNRNRKFPDASTTVIKRDVTIVGGAVIKSVYFGGGGVGQGVAGTYGTGNEFAMVPGSRAFVRITNMNNAASAMSILVTYHEVEAQ